MSPTGKRQLILDGSMKKAIFVLALPLMLDNLIHTLYNLADTFWVGKIGTNELAAMGLVSPFIFLIISLGIGMNVAGTAMISQYTGNDNVESARAVAGQLFTFALISSTVVGIIGYFSAGHLISIVKADPVILELGAQYLSIMFLDMPMVFLFYVYNSVKHGQGDTVTPMILNVCGSVVNIILDPIFIFNLGLGIRGAAIATALSRLIFASYALYTLFAHKQGVYLTLKDLKPNKELLLRVLKVGLPATLGQSGSALGFIVLNAFVISYGSATLAAFTIGNRINSLVLMPVMGIGSALATIIGQNLGADQKDRAKLAFRESIKISILCMALGGCILYVISGPIVGVFVKDDPIVYDLGVSYLKILAASLPLMGIFQVLNGTFQGSGHTGYSMAMEMGRLWLLRIPMIVLFRIMTDWGSNGVWYAMVLSNLFTCTLGMMAYLKGSWQNKIIHEETMA